MEMIVEVIIGWCWSLVKLNDLVVFGFCSDFAQIVDSMKKKF